MNVISLSTSILRKKWVIRKGIWTPMMLSNKISPSWIVASLVLEMANSRVPNYIAASTDTVPPYFSKYRPNYSLCRRPVISSTETGLELVTGSCVCSLARALTHPGDLRNPAPSSGMFSCHFKIQKPFQHLTHSPN